MPALITPASPPSRLAVFVVLLLCFATWMVSHSYQGLFSDARLYTLQALARMHPDSLPQDPFLKFGSQDKFTLFSPVYAATARVLGIEHAAAALTLLFQISLLAGAYALARSVLTGSMVLAASAVVMAIPGDYGAYRVFTCMESFLTPRMAAEGLVLAGLAAALRSRRGLAAALTVLAVLMHPIMAAAGVVALLCLWVALPNPRQSAALTAIGLIAIALWAWVLPAERWGRFDVTWLTLIRGRSPYLFLASWRLDDWSGAAVSTATLLLANRVLPNPAGRRLATAAAITLAGGLALTMVACDWLHLVLFTQAQPWRWQWLGTVVAALLLPATLGELWRREVAGRSAALLLVAAWIFGPSVFGLTSAAAAVMAAIWVPRLKSDESRWIFCGAVGLLLISIVWRIASNLEFTDALYLEPTTPLWIRRTTSFVRDGAAPLAAIACVWVLAHRAYARASLAAIAAATIVLIAALLPQDWRSWSQQEYPRSLTDRFAVLREHIPIAADVLWPDSPLAVWILLDRPSYISVSQTSGMVFSRANALELGRRAEALSPVLSTDTFLNWSNGGPGIALSKTQWTQICDLGVVKFLVTATDLGVEPEAAVPSLSGTNSKKIRLYRCGT